MALVLPLFDAGCNLCRMLSLIVLCRSTAIEVALKMAFRKFLADRPDLLASMQTADQMTKSPKVLGVLGLTNAYHGDTLGTMDAVAPSPYNGLRQTPWYAALVQHSSILLSLCHFVTRVLGTFSASRSHGT